MYRNFKLLSLRGALATWQSLKKIITYLMIVGFILTGKQAIGENIITPKQQYKTLKNLGSIFVDIVDIGKEAKEAGLSKKRLRTMIELKLRQNGIKILDKPKFLKNEKGGYLCLVRVSASSVKDISNPPLDFVFMVSLFTTEATFGSETKKIASTPTWWGKEVWGHCGIKHSLQESVEEELNKILDIFISDYLKAKVENATGK